MFNVMNIKNHQAMISYEPDIELFRGEFIGLNDGADFYADNVSELRKQGEISLKIFLDVCKEKSIEPYKQYSGKFNVRTTPELHCAAVTAAAAQNISLNEWINQTLSSHLQP